MKLHIPARSLPGVISAVLSPRLSAKRKQRRRAECLPPEAKAGVSAFFFGVRGSAGLSCGHGELHNTSHGVRIARRVEEAPCAPLHDCPSSGLCPPLACGWSGLGRWRARLCAQLQANYLLDLPTGRTHAHPHTRCVYDFAASCASESAVNAWAEPLSGEVRRHATLVINRRGPCCAHAVLRRLRRCGWARRVGAIQYAKGSIHACLPYAPARQSGSFSGRIFLAVRVLHAQAPIASNALTTAMTTAVLRAAPEPTPTRFWAPWA